MKKDISARGRGTGPIKVRMTTASCIDCLGVRVDEGIGEIATISACGIRRADRLASSLAERGFIFGVIACAQAVNRNIFKDGAGRGT